MVAVDLKRTWICSCGFSIQLLVLAIRVLWEYKPTSETVFEDSLIQNRFVDTFSSGAFFLQSSVSHLLTEVLYVVPVSGESEPSQCPPQFMTFRSSDAIFLLGKFETKMEAFSQRLSLTVPTYKQEVNAAEFRICARNTGRYINARITRERSENHSYAREKIKYSKKSSIQHTLHGQS